MKVLFLSEQFYPHGGGAELATYLYAKLLSNSGSHVSVVTNSFTATSEILRDANLAVYRLPLFNATGAIKYSILARPDVLLSNLFKKLVKWADAVYIPRFWFSAIPIAKAYGKPVLVHLHDYITMCPLANLHDVRTDSTCHLRDKRCTKKCIYAYERTMGRDMIKALISTVMNSTLGCLISRLVKLSDAVICVSNAQRDIIGRYDASIRAKAHVIYNPLPELARLEINGDDFGYFGAANHLKGYGVLRKAIMLIASKKGDTIKIHATSFPKAKENTSMKGASLLFYERLNTVDIAKIYRLIKAVVFPSIWEEPLPYVVSEALLRGRIVIASKVGGIPEQVHGCKGTYLFEANGHQKLADILEDVSNMKKETADDLGIHNREVFTRNFSNEKTANEFTKLLAGLSNA